MLFSIIIPIYNDEEFLEECLKSCLDQTLSADEYEIVCINDGSTDRTPEILRAYASEHPNLRVITKPHGVAYGRGRDIGFEVAQEDFVWFVDHDDIVAPNALVEIQKAISGADRFERIGFPYYEFFEELTPIEKGLMREGKLVANSGDAYSTLSLWSGVIRRSFMKENNIWPHSKRISAAGDFWAIKDFSVWGSDNVCMEECFDKGMRTKQLTGRPLYHYRRHSSSQTMSFTKESAEKRETLSFEIALLRALSGGHAERAVAYRASQKRPSFQGNRCQYDDEASQGRIEIGNVAKKKMERWDSAATGKRLVLPAQAP